MLCSMIMSLTNIYHHRGRSLNNLQHCVCLIKKGRNHPQDINWRLYDASKIIIKLIYNVIFFVLIYQSLYVTTRTIQLIYISIKVSHFMQGTC